MLIYYGRLNTFICLSDKYIFYCIHSFHEVVPFDSPSVESIKSQFDLIYKPCSMERFEKAFITDLNDDDNIYLYLKVKGENK